MGKAVLPRGLLRLFLLVIPSALMMTMNGCGGRMCTLMGCLNQATITIRHADGTPPALALSLELDGDLVECPAPRQAAIESCASFVTTEQREVQICREERNGNAVSYQCQGTGQFEQLVTIQSTPQRIKLVVQDGSQVGSQRVIEPVYQRVRPNGDGCEPVCSQAAEEWLLP